MGIHAVQMGEGPHIVQRDIGLGAVQYGFFQDRGKIIPQSYMIFAPWYAIAPGVMILMLTLGLGFVSHGREEKR